MLGEWLARNLANTLKNRENMFPGGRFRACSSKYVLVGMVLEVVAEEEEEEEEAEGGMIGEG